MTIYDIIKELGVTEGYSPLLGDCEIDLDNETIWIRNEGGAWVVFDKDGKFDKKGECVIFPSKDNRDWEKELEEKEINCFLSTHRLWYLKTAEIGF